MACLQLSCLVLLLLAVPALLAHGAQLQDGSDDLGADALNFIVLGDWGGKPSYPYTTEAETSIAGVMGKVASEMNSQFTLALGDNFYDTGVKNVYDHRFNYTFEVSACTTIMQYFLII